MKPAPPPPSAEPYLVDAILRACTVLHTFRVEGELLRLRDIVLRTGLHKATAYRSLRSLEAGGLLERVGPDQYRSRVRPLGAQRVRLGYAALAGDSVFSRDVTEGLRRAAAAGEVELVECDNRYSAKRALRNAERLIDEKVDLAIEVQIHEDIAPAIAARFEQAAIPLIAVDIPHPGAVYFGGDNYLAGRIGGRALARWALSHWNGQVDAVLLLTLVAAGALPSSRMSGIAVGIKELLPALDQSRVTRVDAKGGYVESMEATAAFLRKNSARRVLVGAMNDASALGALRALNEAARPLDFAVVGQNATSAGRAELRKPGTRLIGSVAFFPEKYGHQLIHLALDMLRNKPVPPAVFVKHTLITPENVDHFYPNDALLPVPDADTLLWSCFH